MPGLDLLSGLSRTSSKWFDRGTQDILFNRRQKVVPLWEEAESLGYERQKERRTLGRFTVGTDRGSRKIDLVHGVLRERFFLGWDGGRCRFDW